MKSRVPILDHKHHDRLSVFAPDGLLVPAAPYAHIPAEMLTLGESQLAGSERVVRGGVRTTDAPFWETEEAKLLAEVVEMMGLEPTTS